VTKTAVNFVIHESSKDDAVMQLIVYRTPTGVGLNELDCLGDYCVIEEAWKVLDCPSLVLPNRHGE
jgi:hypothetical protein